MKKIVASVGLVALGATGLQAASLSGITSPDPGKPWSVSATLRGFYDDNVNSAPNDRELGQEGFHRDSFGYEISPSILLNFPWEQTTLSLGYTFSFKYYENQLLGTEDHDDMSHTINLAFDHAFNERYRIAVKDSFVIGQEPDMLRVNNTMETFQRVPGDNMRNYGSIVFDGQATRLFGYEVGYANSFFDYDAEQTAGLLNRVENMGHFDTRWQLLPQTVGVLGYQFRDINYTGDQEIGGPGSGTFSEDRNARIHYGYAGVDHAFRPDLTGSLRAGAQFIDYYNDPNTESDVSPYVLASLRWTYMPESYLEVGFTHDINSTDILGAPDAEGSFTMSAESSVAYLTLNQRITPKLFGSLMAQFQNSSYNGGSLDGESEQFWMAGLNLEYRFNPNFSAHVGYSYDRLGSDILWNPADATAGDRSFDRNRVYIGLTARY